ncbi:hypothetical protein ACFLTH_17185 [Bacteroidota bacterium]
MRKLILVLFLIFVLSTVSASATNYYVATTGDDSTGDGSSGNPWLTIQHAIDTVGDGDTINVATGTYAEDLTITTDNIEIVGADKATTTIKGVANVPQASWPLAVPNIDIQADGVTIHEFTIAGPDYEADKYVSGMLVDGQDVEIYNNDFVATAAEAEAELAHAFMTYSNTGLPSGSADVSGLNVHDNTFTGAGSIGLEAIYINPHDGTGTVTINNNQLSGSINIGVTVESGNAVVTDNTIDTTLDTETVPYGTYGIRFFDSTYEGTFDSITIADNNVQNFKRGIRIGNGGNNGGTATTEITASITGNTLTGNSVGIWARQYGAVVTATGNTITGNTVGIQNDGTTSVTAENNWWGDVDPSDDVSGTVDYSPWLGEEVGTSPMTWYTDDSIQDVIDVASAGDTIIVAAGTYTEDLTITTDNLEIVGADKSTTTIKGVANVPVASWPLAVPNIDIQADGVTIHEFTIAGPDYEADKYVSGMLVDGQDVEIYNNDFVATAAEAEAELAHAFMTYSNTGLPSGSADVSGLNVHDNTFTGAGSIGLEAIYINPHDGTGTVTINNNQLSGSINIGVTVESGNAVVTDNTIDTTLDTETVPYGTYGIRFFDSTYEGTFDSITIADNNVQNFKRGIRIGNGGNNGGTATTEITASITGNTLTGNSVGIWARQYGAVVTATGNTITGNTVGIQNDGTTSVTAENNWWGAADGPSGEGSGTGDSVSTFVDYDPWYLDSEFTYLSGAACSAGEIESQSCGSSVGVCQAGTQTRVCTSEGTWDSWSVCGGTYVAPSSEICDDKLDNDCDGYTDSIDSDCSGQFDYYTKTESDGLFATLTDIADMATKTWVNNLGFITKSVSDLTNYYLKTEIDTAIDAEASTRSNEDNNLQGQVDDLENRALQNEDGLDIYLTQGWNTFKLPWFVLVGTDQVDGLDVENYEVETVLESIDGSYDYLAYYDGTDWQTFVPGDDDATSFTEFPTSATQEDFDFHIYMDEGARLTIDIGTEE